MFRFAPAVAGEGFTTPFGVGSVVALGRLFGGRVDVLDGLRSEAAVTK